MSTKNAYRLINPYIEGSVDTMVRARNTFSAGKKLYGNISKFFTNHVEDFNMTIQNIETKELAHFRINEKRGKENVIDFNMVKLDESLPSRVEKELINSIEKIEKQSGGKKHHHHHDDSSESSSSCSSDSFFRTTSYVQPITRFVYFNLPYYKIVGLSPYDVNRLFLPVFSWPLSPVMEIRLDLYRI